MNDAFKSSFDRFFAGPLVVLAGLLVIHLAWPGWTAVTLAPLFPLLAFGCYISGLRANLASALFISLYAWRAVNYDPLRAGIVAFSAFVMVGIVGTLRRQREAEARAAERNTYALNMVRTANGNLDRLEKVHNRTIDLDHGWNVITDEAKHREVTWVRGELATLRTIWQGWHQLYREREVVKGDSQ